MSISYLGILLILLLGWLLRLYNLDFQPLWWDEGYTVYFATLSLPELLTETAHLDHPPLYWMAIKLWGGFAGLSPWSTRFFSVLWGILTVALVYRLARFFLPTWSALVAALFAAFAPFLLWHSREARMYSLVFTIALLSTVLALRLAQSQAKRSAWSLYFLTLAGGALTHYFLILLWPVHTLLWLWRKQQRLLGLGIVAAAIVFSLPWWLFVGANLPGLETDKIAGQSGDLLYQLFRAAGWGTGGGEKPLTLVEFVYRLAGSYSVGYTPGFDSGLPFAGGGATFTIIFLLVLVLAGVIFFLRRALLHHDGIPGWFLVSLLIPLTVAYAIQQFLPFANFIRLIGYVAPLLYIFLAAGVYFIATSVKWQKPIGIGLTLLTVSVLVPSLQAYFPTPWDPTEDYRPLLAALEGGLQTGDALLAEFPWQVGYLRSYLDAPRLIVYYPPLDTWAHNPPLLRAELQNILERHRRLWYPFYQGLPDTLGVRIKRYLDRNFSLVLNQPYGKTNLLLYTVQSS